MSVPRRTALLTAAALALSGCTAVQDALQVGEREFTFDTAAQAQESPEAFRFQGFLPADATDIRLRTRLDGDESVFRWTSPTEFRSEHCTQGQVATEPRISADWLPSSLPEDGWICGSWTVVRSEDTQYAWNGER